MLLAFKVQCIGYEGVAFEIEVRPGVEFIKVMTLSRGGGRGEFGKA